MFLSVMHPLRYQPPPLPPPPARVPLGMTRTRTALPAVTGEVVSVDPRTGTGTVRISTTGQVFQFSLSDVTGDMSKVVKGGVVTGLLMGDRVCGVAVVRGPAVGACDNPRLRQDPPFFVMRWNFDELKKNPVREDATEIPVVLVDNRENMFIAMTELMGEKIEKNPVIGIDVITGLNQGKPVLCLSLSTCVVVIELSLLEEIDANLFSCFFMGLVDRANAGLFATPFACLRENPMQTLAEAYPHLYPASAHIRVTNVLQENTLEDTIAAIFGYRMGSLDEVTDLASMAFHLGRTCFHARQILSESVRQPSETSHQPNSVYRQFQASNPLKRSRPNNYGPPLPPPVSRPVVQFDLPPPSPISEGDEEEGEEEHVSVPTPAPVPTPEVPAGASMAELLEKVRASKRIPSTEDVVQPEESFLQWFEQPKNDSIEQ
jgi:hypothetical protein